MKLLGILLAVLGAIALFVPSITFFTSERVADAGFFAIDVSKPHTIVLNPAVGAALLALGLLLLVVGRKPANA